MSQLSRDTRQGLPGIELVDNTFEPYNRKQPRTKAGEPCQW